LGGFQKRACIPCRTTMTQTICCDNSPGGFNIPVFLRSTSEAATPAEPFGYVLEKSGINNGYYFLTAKEAEHIEDRFKRLYTPVYVGVAQSEREPE
jgi:hypothetical protein